MCCGDYDLSSEGEEGEAEWIFQKPMIPLKKDLVAYDPDWDSRSSSPSPSIDEEEGSASRMDPDLALGVEAYWKKKLKKVPLKGKGLVKSMRGVAPWMQK